jgi:hypothetical protein
MAKIGLHPRRHARIELISAHNLNGDKFGSPLRRQIRDDPATNDVRRLAGMDYFEKWHAGAGE